jgi:hypothetical protein
MRLEAESASDEGERERTSDEEVDEAWPYDNELAAQVARACRISHGVALVIASYTGGDFRLDIVYGVRGGFRAFRQRIPLDWTIEDIGRWICSDPGLYAELKNRYPRFMTTVNGVQVDEEILQVGSILNETGVPWETLCSAEFILFAQKTSLGQYDITFVADRSVLPFKIF